MILVLLVIPANSHTVCSPPECRVTISNVALSQSTGEMREVGSGKWWSHEVYSISCVFHLAVLPTELLLADGVSTAEKRERKEGGLQMLAYVLMHEHHWNVKRV